MLKAKECYKMVRKLMQNDNEQVMRFLKKDPEYNIFIIGDIEQFGYVCEFQTVWGEFDKDKLVAVLLQYRTNIVYYSPNKRSIDPFKEVLEGFKYDIVNGKKEAIEVFEEFLSDWKLQDMYFCSLDSFKKEDADTTNVSILRTYEDFCDEHDLLGGIEEFTEREEKESYARHQSELAMKDQRLTYALRVDGELVSVASVVAENTVNGMIVGVATNKKYRGKGYASVVMNELCNDFLNVKNKSLCLFFDNPKAGSIYHRLGFKDIGMYRMYSRQ
jgi:predicted GNAT family acetyltransferase